MLAPRDGGLEQHRHVQTVVTNAVACEQWHLNSLVEVPVFESAQKLGLLVNANQTTRTRTTLVRWALFWYRKRKRTFRRGGTADGLLAGSLRTLALKAAGEAGW